MATSDAEFSESIGSASDDQQVDILTSEEQVSEDELASDASSVEPAFAKNSKAANKRKTIYESSDSEEDELEDSEEEKPVYSKQKKQKNSKPGRPPGRKPKIAKKSGARPVPFDAVSIPTGEKGVIEKMISYREVEGDPENIEIMVKYKNMSYNSCEWLPREVVEEGLKQGKQRVKRLLEKPVYELQWSEDEIFNPAFCKIDRVIDEGELDGHCHYLVKWCSLPYDECTWEEEEVVEEMDSSKIDDFHDRREPSKEKVESYKNELKKRPQNWRKMEKSPEYKNDNQLRSYQLEGLNWLLFCWHNYQNCILADEMGLGKTVQSTAFLYHLYKKQNIKGPFLIVTPLSTLGNWEREIKTWTDMNLVVYHGRDVARNLIVESEYYYKDSDGSIDGTILKFDILLTTYEMAMTGLSQLKPIKWKCCILDEAHRLKNKTSKISETLKQYYFEHKVLLTGTPLQNSLEELWSLLNFLDTEKFGDEKQFNQEYGNLTSAADVEKLQLLLKPLMLRRLKEDVEKTIPVKEETIVEVELTTIQKKWYRSILERNFSWLKQGSKRNNMPNLINTMIELRKCCIHPFLLRGAEEAIYDEYKASTSEQHFQVMIQACGKMVLIDKLLRKLKAGGHKVLLFSQMTKCLDIIQDYLRGRGYGYERIDGSIRGDLRQAAIDRFSDPNSESFVFLLCTRAGGVGINLTVADTVIIYDSDWNPQNDLQAQARCHRIGQTKSVQIYRLVTRNTYEKDMLDRASMKLGLDKAILQRMDAQSAYEPSNETGGGAPSSLSKQEVEELLKKGAYGALMDDEDSNRFCEEDIDQILERRTKIVRHDNTAEKGSIFSKASFAASSTDDIDINDPDFWDKVAERAQFEIVEEEFENQHLIVTEPRARRQVQRFGLGDELESEDESEDETGVKRPRGGINDPKHWTGTEKSRFERCVMLFGFSGWEKFLPSFPRRTIQDLRAVGVQLAKHCLSANIAWEAELISDVNLVLKMEEEALKEEFGDDAQFNDETPYPDATAKQIQEFKTFLGNPEYQEHIFKKAKSLLTRIQMMHIIRDKINPTDITNIPSIPGAAPASWWGDDEDKDLLVGVLKHGYGQYEKIRDDPELCYRSKFYDSDGNYLFITEPIEPLQPDQQPLEQQQLEANVEEPMITDTQRSVQPDTMHSSDLGLSANDSEEQQQHLTEDNGLQGMMAWPNASDLGIRIRKIMAAFQRDMNAAAREKSRKQYALLKQRAKKEKDQEKIKAREREFTRRDKAEFMRTLISFGVEYQDDKKVWNRFRLLSGLKKSDDILEDYLQKTLALSEEVIEKAELAKTQLTQEPITEAVEGEESKKFNIYTFKIERDGESMNYEKAKKLLKRLENMKKLRENVLIHPELDSKLAALKRNAKAGVPGWWQSPEHDKYFLLGVSRWGIQRSDLITSDPSLPFAHLQSNFHEDADEEKFWMKEAAAVRRFELLLDHVLGNNKLMPITFDERYTARTFITRAQKMETDEFQADSKAPEHELQQNAEDLDPKDQNAHLEDLLFNDQMFKLLYFNEFLQYKKSAEKSYSISSLPIKRKRVEKSAEPGTPYTTITPAPEIN